MKEYFLKLLNLFLFNFILFLKFGRKLIYFIQRMRKKKKKKKLIK